MLEAMPARGCVPKNHNEADAIALLLAIEEEVVLLSCVGGPHENRTERYAGYVIV